MLKPGKSQVNQDKLVTLERASILAPHAPYSTSSQNDTLKSRSCYFSAEGLRNPEQSNCPFLYFLHAMTSLVLHKQGKRASASGSFLYLEGSSPRYPYTSFPHFLRVSAQVSHISILLACFFFFFFNE